MKLYHVSYTNYTKDAVIVPGEFGAMIRRTDTHDRRNVIESRLEDVRRNHVGADVSRLECIFAFSNSTDAENFALSRPRANIYELEIESGAPIGMGNYRVVSYFLGLLGSEPSIDDHIHLFDQYWTESETSEWLTNDGFDIGYIQEILIGGNARVIQVFPP